MKLSEKMRRTYQNAPEGMVSAVRVADWASQVEDLETVLDAAIEWHVVGRGSRRLHEVVEAYLLIRGDSGR